MVALELSRLDDRALMDLRDEFESLLRPWRELAILAACCHQSAVDLAHLSVGARDRLLLRVRCSLFGSRVEAESRCEACGERLDLWFDVGELLAATEPTGTDETRRADLPSSPTRGTTAIASAAAADASTAVELETGGLRLRLRAPDTADIAAAIATPDPELTVLTRCIEHAEDVASVLLQDPCVRDAIAVKLAEIDPGAEIALTAACPRCSARSQTTFDPGGFLLAEITTYTDRLIDEIDQLARVYGWSEADILALGARRRRRYLELMS